MRKTGEPTKTATIREVALAAGVSRSSVSNFMNGRLARLGPETRERIAEVIESLGYKPNRLARQLKTGKVTTLGLLVPTVVNPFFGELAFAIEQAAGRRGHHVLLCNTMRDGEREEEVRRELMEHGVRGLINVSPLLPRKGWTRPDDDMAMIGIDMRRAGPRTRNADFVNIDNRAAASLAVRHLVGFGHRHIAYLADADITFSRAERRQGFLEAVEEEGLEAVQTIPDGIGDIRPWTDADMWDLGRRGADALLAMVPRPTAVVALNDMAAIGLLAQLRRVGVSVPGGIAVVGMDDIGLSQLVSPSLSTVRQPIEDMAEAAVERLIVRLADPSRPGTDIVFQPQLIARESSALVPERRSPV